MKFILIVLVSFFILSTDILGVSCNDRILLLPPHTKTFEASEYLQTHIRSKIILEDKVNCSKDVFISLDESAGTADYIGWSYNDDLDIAFLTKRKVRFLVEQTDVTHIAYVKNSKMSEMTFEVYRIMDNHELIFEHESKLPNPVNVEASLKPKDYLFYLLPNSWTIGFTNTSVEYNAHKGYVLGESLNRGSVPPFLSAISFTKVSHEKRFALFDYEWSLFPGTYFFAIHNEVPVLDATGSITLDKIDQEVYGACPNFNGMLSLHTPLGTTYTALGYGPCLFLNRKDTRAMRTYADTSAKITLGHRVFITLNLFIYLEADSLKFGNRLYASEYAKSETILRSTLGLGWYIPNIERSSHQLLSNAENQLKSYYSKN